MDKVIGYIEDIQLTKVKTMYPELLLEFCSRSLKGKRDFRELMSSLKTRLRELEASMVRSFEDNCNFELFTKKSHSLDHLCDYLQKFCIESSFAALYKQLRAVLERAYHRTPMRRDTRIQDSLTFEVDSTKAKNGEMELKQFSRGWKQHMWFLGKNGPETAVMETLTKNLSRDVVYKFADVIRVQAEESIDPIENGNIGLMFPKSAWIGRYDVPILEQYDWKDITVIVKKERFGERYCEHIFASA